MATMMEHVTLTAPDMSCAHREATIEEEVGALPGVAGVAADSAAKRIDIDFDPNRVTLARIEAALDEDGFPVQK